MAKIQTQGSVAYTLQNLRIIIVISDKAVRTTVEMRYSVDVNPTSRELHSTIYIGHAWVDILGTFIVCPQRQICRRSHVLSVSPHCDVLRYTHWRRVSGVVDRVPSKTWHSYSFSCGEHISESVKISVPVLIVNSPATILWITKTTGTYSTFLRNHRCWQVKLTQGVRCGTILLDKCWVRSLNDLEEPLTFIAISEAKKFTDEEYND